MDITKVLTSKYPNSIWTLDGNDYSGLTWLSETPQPTEKEIIDLWPEVEAELQAKEQARIDAKASAIAKLEALGLTVEEVEVAFGLSA